MTLKLRKYILDNKIVMTELAQLLGCSYIHLSEISSGRREPGLFLAKAISEITKGKVLVEDLRKPKIKLVR